ncbi:MAG: hypothetical protein CMG75_07740 [Candidatus Marinimicrobia bacterium]|nr:hypothetical protein [Candidatus Neomarinimicrobiota bacterium]|tara:strand:- start:226 stop:1395 length:1170 start_codon:yes stop_codon:yes gene_type:complete
MQNDLIKSKEIGKKNIKKGKKVLYIFRHDELSDYFSENGSFNGPADFLWGLGSLNTEKIERYFINAPRLEKRTGIRKITNIFERPFSKYTKIGFPIEIYPLYKKQINRADEIFCVNDAISLSILFWKALGKMKKKKIRCIIMSLQEREKYFKLRKIIIRFISFLFRQADTLITLSNEAKNNFSKKYYIGSTNVETCYFGIDTLFWTPSDSIEKDDYILSVGNDMNRDFNTLIKALPKTQKLKIVTKRNLDINKKKIDIINNWVSDNELKGFYQKAKIVIIPSINVENESPGLSCSLQALSCKSPLIIPKIPTLSELFRDNIDCLFYEPENSEDLMEKIETLNRDETKRKNLSKNGYNTVIQKYNCITMGKRLTEIINEENNLKHRKGFL